MTNPETLPFPGFDATTVNCVHVARDIQIAIDGREEAICFKCKSRESYLCSGNRIATNENETQNLLINAKNITVLECNVKYLIFLTSKVNF